MAHELTTSYAKDSTGVFRYYKKLAERAMAQCPDDALFATLDAESNSIGVIAVSYTHLDVYKRQK